MAIPACSQPTLGSDLAGLLSVQTDRIYHATPTSESPIECHAGSLSEFGVPSIESCEFVSMSELLANPMGSVTRAIPPQMVAEPPT